MLEKTEEQTRLGEFVPTIESKDKAFQEDAYRNFRISVEGEVSEWKKNGEVAILNVHGKTYIGVTDSYDGDLPKKCALKLEVVDEDGESDFYKFKITDLTESKVLGADDVEEILREPLYEDDEHIFNIKNTKLKGFVKIMMTELEGSMSDHIMTKEEIEEYLKNALPSEEFEIINEDGEKINSE